MASSDDILNDIRDAKALLLDSLKPKPGVFCNGCGEHIGVLMVKKQLYRMDFSQPVELPIVAVVWHGFRCEPCDRILAISDRKEVREIALVEWEAIPPFV